MYDASPGASIVTDLSLDQDAARVILGEGWRMPSSAEFQELVDNCTHEWTTLNNVPGVMFISNVNGRRIFFPAAGLYNGLSLNSEGTLGYYWSTMHYNAASAYNLRISSAGVNAQRRDQRHYGFSVRAVMNPT